MDTLYFAAIFPFLLGVPILLMAWVGLKEHRKDKRALKKGDYKELMVKSYSLKDLPDYSETLGMDSREKIFICEDENGNVIEYEDLVAKSEAIIRSSENEIRQLTHIRDYLLPLLLNGQLSMDV